MNRNAISGRSFRLLAGFFGVALFAVLAGFYTFGTSAQEDDQKAVPEQVLTNGRLAFIRRTAGPMPGNLVGTSNADGTGRVLLPLNGQLMPETVTWSPDGNKLAFSGLGEIYVVNPDGTGLTNITNSLGTETEVSPTWGVGGKIAYALLMGPNVGKIGTMNPDGTGKSVFPGITQPSAGDPAWSRDGTKLAFTSNGEIWSINADGTNEQRLTFNGTTDEHPSWSPDGSKVIFAKLTSGISTVNANGTGETPVSLNNNDRAPSYSPDGTMIAFRSTSGIWTMSPDGSNRVRIHADVINFPLCCDLVFESPAWQPVGQPPNTNVITGRITYNNLAVPGVTVNVAGTVNAATTTDLNGNYQFTVPTGGSYRLAPSYPKHFFTPATRLLLWIASNQTGQDFEVAAVCQYGRCIKNGRIAYTRDGEIYTINVDGTGETNISSNNASDVGPDYSPDGSLIAFTSNRDGNNEIYRMGSSGAAPTRLTNNGANDTSPNYSPDGVSIVFNSDRDGNFEIYKMNADGTNPVRLTTDSAPDINPAFSADGKRIIWTVGSTGPGVFAKVFTMNADGSDKQQLPAPTGPSPAYEKYTYSPDGQKIMFTYTPDTTSTFRATWTMNANGTGGTPYPVSGTNGTYSPDGSMTADVCCIFNATNRLRVANASIGLLNTLTPSSIGNSLPDWQTVLLPGPAPFDFDGDGKTDITVYRPTNGVWYSLNSTDGFRSQQWGDPADILVPADYDGDRKADIAVWRPSNGNFYIINTFDSTVRVDTFGQAGDVPVGGDWDADGRADVAVYRDAVSGTQSYFYYRGTMGNPSGITTFVPWGKPGDKPVVGDYDGDGRTDAAVYRNGDWWVLKSSDLQYIAVHFGIPTDKTVQSDYDGDGKTDMAVYRDGIWYLLRSKDGYTGYAFGIATDQPAPGDYDGDGKADTAVLRDGVWWVLKSSDLQPYAVVFGSPDDKPVPGAFVR